MRLLEENPDIEPGQIAGISPDDRLGLADFWPAVIQPILESAKAQTVLEVGANEGENTVNLLAYCARQQGHLHIVDPLPKFDVQNFRRQFGSIFTLHRDLSLNILPHLGQFDAILLDGDHNWYTVYHELKQIEAAHRATPATYPLILLHDVEWPYARRDMYYQPDTIPAEYRQPYARLGILPGLELSWVGGLNPDLNNAKHEGGEKNGVLTAIEDFLAETTLEFKFIHLPVSYGLGILIASARWRSQPELRRCMSEATSEAAIAALQIALSAAAGEAMLRWQARPYQISLQPVLNKRLIESSTAPKPHISMIVVLYNMRREAERTLHSLSARYQQEIDESDYEVIVVENGSTEPLENTDLSRFGPNFSYHYLPTASPSPVEAINFGANLARGDYLGIMIDGAHILTPGVLKYAQLAFQIYDNPVVAVKMFHLGSAPQPLTLQHGYNQQVEDNLLKQIGWPQNGYRMFEVGRVINSKLGWFHPINESNCLFVSRQFFAELGGYDSGFKSQGGGFVNIDFYDRALAAENATPVIMLGEATFHQTHGGVTTSPKEADFSHLFKDFMAEYRSIRGKEMTFPTKTLHFLGHMPPLAALAADISQDPNWLAQELDGKEQEIRQLAETCAEREALIHQLSTICAEREAVIQQLAAGQSRNIIRRLANKLLNRRGIA